MCMMTWWPQLESVLWRHSWRYSNVMIGFLGSLLITKWFTSQETFFVSLYIYRERKEKDFWEVKHLLINYWHCSNFVSYCMSRNHILQDFYKLFSHGSIMKKCIHFCTNAIKTVDCILFHLVSSGWQYSITWPVCIYVSWLTMDGLVRLSHLTSLSFKNVIASWLFCAVVRVVTVTAFFILNNWRMFQIETGLGNLPDPTVTGENSSECWDTGFYTKFLRMYTRQYTLYVTGAGPRHMVGRDAEGDDSGTAGAWRHQRWPTEEVPPAAEGRDWGPGRLICHGRRHRTQDDRRFTLRQERCMF